MPRELLFTVTHKDCELQRFRAGGKGGQKQNKTESGVRLIHHPSGARGESRSERSFEQNRKNAFFRLIQSVEFEVWRKKEAARRLGVYQRIEEEVERQMLPHHLKIEYYDAD